MLLIRLSNDLVGFELVVLVELERCVMAAPCCASTKANPQRPREPLQPFHSVSVQFSRLVQLYLKFFFAASICWNAPGSKNIVTAHGDLLMESNHEHNTQARNEI